MLSSLPQILFWMTVGTSFLATCSLADVIGHTQQGPFTKAGPALKDHGTGNIGPPIRRQGFAGHGGSGPASGHGGSGELNFPFIPSEVFTGNAFHGVEEHGPFIGQPPSVPSHILRTSLGSGKGLSAEVAEGGIQSIDHTGGNPFVNGPFKDHPAGGIRHFEQVPFRSGHFIGQSLAGGPFAQTQSEIPDSERHSVPLKTGHFPFNEGLFSGPVKRDHLFDRPSEIEQFPLFNRGPPELGHFTGSHHFPERLIQVDFDGNPHGGHFVDGSPETGHFGGGLAGGHFGGGHASGDFGGGHADGHFGGGHAGGHFGGGHAGGHFVGHPITEHTLTSSDLHIEEGHNPSGFNNGGGHVSGHKGDTDTHFHVASNHGHIQSGNGDVRVHSEKAIKHEHGHPQAVPGNEHKGEAVAVFINRPVGGGTGKTTVTKVPVKEISFKDIFNAGPNLHQEHFEAAHNSPSSGHAIGVHHPDGPRVTHARTQNTAFRNTHHEGPFGDGFAGPNRGVEGSAGEATASVNFSFGAPRKSEDSDDAKHASLDVRDSQS